MKSRLIFLGTEENIKEAFLLLVDQDGKPTWHHYDFHEDDIDSAIQQIVKTKQLAGIDEVAVTCAVEASIEDLGWPIGG